MTLTKKGLIQKLAKWWKSEYSEEIYTIELNGSITKSIICSNTLEQLLISKQGNVFKTRKEAKQEVKWRGAKYNLKKTIFELNNGWKPDWNSKDSKYHVFYDSLDKKFNYFHTTCMKGYQDWFYLKSEKLVEKLIEEHENDLLVYLEVQDEIR